MRLKRLIIQIGVALTTPLLEKNPAKSTGLARRKTPFVFSMFGIGSIRQIRDPFASEPSKFDDHANDTPVARATPSRRKAA